MNDEEIRQGLARSLPMTERNSVEWLEAFSRAKTHLGFGIVSVQDSALVGVIALYGINWQHKTAYTGIIIGEREYWGKGYGTEAKMMLSGYAFNSLDMFALLSRVPAHNDKAVSHAMRCGYEEVARIPKWCRRTNGDRCDEILFLLTQEKWRRLQRGHA